MESGGLVSEAHFFLAGYGSCAADPDINQINSLTMPLVIMCGIPSSGKTTRAMALKAALEERHKCKVVLINE